MITTVLAVVGILGGSMAIELPADKKVKELEIRVSQTWQQQERYHQRKELDEIQWRLRYLTDEINRLNQIPQYLGRPLTPQEEFRKQQLLQEFTILKERAMHLSSG